ncbi:hypothetical protein ACE193_21200 [Bernardetia sp. OM2101]|uniref:hypothetical protein n=1 Tax=Bernardetia sp. OM2101 TaxID=3344876 RepID=UPI0035CF440F
MSQPNNRIELERKLYLFKEQLENGNVYFSIHTPRLGDSVKNVKSTPNLRVNLRTVNSLVRASINVIDLQFSKQEK